jgi:hypothetical protein
MNPTKIYSLLLLCGTLAFLGGCASSEPESHLVTAPPPPAPGMAPAPAQVVVVTQPQAQQVVAVSATPTTANSYVVVQAPPAPQPPEAIPAQPSSQHVWVAGYWTWQNNRYAWMAGHWEVPPYANAKWTNPRWEPEGNAFRFYEGSWN